jgi:FtsH-binding integral membrane protein
MVSWVAQDSDGLLDVDAPAVWLIGAAGLVLSALAAFFASQKPWRAGSMKLAPSFAKIMFVTMIALTAMWIFIAIAHTRTQTAQALYGLCTALSGWSAWAIFITLRDFEAVKP